MDEIVGGRVEAMGYITVFKEAGHWLGNCRSSLIQQYPPLSPDISRSSCYGSANGEDAINDLECLYFP